MLAPLGLREYQDFKRVVIIRGIYTIIGTTLEPLQTVGSGNRVIHLRKSLSKDSTLDQKII